MPFVSPKDTSNKVSALKEKMIVLGSGGHACVLLDIAETCSEFEVVGCVAQERKSTELPVPFLGDLSNLPQLFTDGVRRAFVAIGDNKSRQQVTARVLALGFDLVNLISPQAAVSRRAHLGNGIAIMPGVVVNAGARLEDGCILNSGAIVEHDCRIGPYSHVAPAAALAGDVEIEEGAFLAVGVRVLPGIRIGSWTTVGAGAVVIRDLPSRVTAVGVPARILRGNDFRS